MRLQSLLALFLTASAAPGIAFQCGGNGHCHLSHWTATPPVVKGLFGNAVELDSELALVGEPGAGRVHVFERVGGLWSPLTVLVDPNGAGNDFGTSLGMSDDFLVVGAPRDGTQGNNAGAAHIWQRTPGGLVFSQTVYDSTPLAGARFGHAVDTAGAFVVVGAPNDSAGGSVHQFLRTFASWEVAQVDTSVGGVEYGFALAVRDGLEPLQLEYLVGDPGAGLGGADTGRVQHRVWDLGFLIGLFSIDSPNPSPGDRFGHSLALEGSLAVIGSPLADDVAPDAGAAYVVELLGLPAPGGELLLDTLHPCIATSGRRFGQAVAVGGDRVAVGEPFGPGAAGAGGAYVFRPGLFAGYDLEGRMTPVDGQLGDGFGYAVGLDGDGLLVGARSKDVGGAGPPSANAGSATFVSLAPQGALGGQCPCDALAFESHYGVGKPGSGGVVPKIELGSPAVPGSPSLLRVYDALIGANPVLAYGTASIDLDLGELSLYVADPILVPLPPVTALGQVGVEWTVPSAPSICGQELFAQAFYFDPGAGGVLKLAHTDGLAIGIGY